MGRKDRIKPDVVAAELDKLRGKQVDGKVNLGDATYIKRALDEAAAKVFSSHIAYRLLQHCNVFLSFNVSPAVLHSG